RPPTAAQVSVVAAVPVKDLANAKQRLIPVLTAAERRALAETMLEDVLEALVTALPGSVVVVTADGEVVALARRRGGTGLIESANRGHTEAVAVAQRHARESGAGSFLTIPGDVPCVTADEIRAVRGASTKGPGVVFVPSVSGLGTNAAFLTPPDAMP